jgi:hypothetical protein
MIESITGVLFDDWALGVESKNFESGTKSVHQDGEKEECASLEKAVCIGPEVVKDATDDESRDTVSEKLGNSDAGISFETLEATP